MYKLIIAPLLIFAACTPSTEVNPTQKSQSITSPLIYSYCQGVDSVDLSLPVGQSEIIYDFTNCNLMGVNNFAVILSDIQGASNKLECTLTTPTKTAIKIGSGHWYEFFNQDIQGEVATFKINNKSNKPINVRLGYKK